MTLKDRFGDKATELVGVVPGTITTLTTANFYIGAIVLINNSAADVTINIKDLSTGKGGSPWEIIPTNMTLTAGSVFIMEYPFIRAAGIQWSSSDASGVVGRILGTY